MRDFSFHTPDVLFIDERIMLRESVPLYHLLSENHPQTSIVLMCSDTAFSDKANPYADYCISKTILDEKQIHALWKQLSAQSLRQKPAIEPLAICRIKDYILEHLQEELSLTLIASEFGYNYSYLSSCFSHYTKKSFKHYVNELRIQYACRLLREDNLSISEAGIKAGYTSQSYFNQVFKKYTGSTPGAYQLRHRSIGRSAASLTLSDVSCIPQETYSHICGRCG